jgi:hypothetical protein
MATRRVVFRAKRPPEYRVGKLTSRELRIIAATPRIAGAVGTSFAAPRPHHRVRNHLM